MVSFFLFLINYVCFWQKKYIGLFRHNWLLWRPWQFLWVKLIIISVSLNSPNSISKYEEIIFCSNKLVRNISPWFFLTLFYTYSRNKEWIYKITFLMESSWEINFVEVLQRKRLFVEYYHHTNITKSINLITKLDAWRSIKTIP